MTETCVTFVSRAAYENNIAQKLGLQCKVLPVSRTRSISKRDMVRNDAMPRIEVNPETFAVMVDGVQATVPPLTTIAMNQLHLVS